MYAAVFDAINDDYKFRLLLAKNIPENKETDHKSVTSRAKNTTTNYIDLVLLFIPYKINLSIVKIISKW